MGIQITSKRPKKTRRSVFWKAYCAKRIVLEKLILTYVQKKKRRLLTKPVSFIFLRGSTQHISILS